MRIVAGEFRGRRLLAPKGRAVRPTTDRVREAVFSIIAARLPDARVLDLFAGTGALGLEALSRGASRAVFVDVSPDSIRLIQANIAACGATERTEVVRGSAPQVLRLLAGREDRFDLIFMDPPYGEGQVEAALPLVEAVAGEDALVVAEHHIKDVLPDRVGRWTRARERRYGDTMISLYEYDDGS